MLGSLSRSAVTGVVLWVRWENMHLWHRLGVTGDLGEAPLMAPRLPARHGPYGIEGKPDYAINTLAK